MLRQLANINNSARSQLMLNNIHLEERALELGSVKKIP